MQISSHLSADVLKFTSLLSIRYSVVMRLDSTVACCQTTHWLLPLRRRKLNKDTINACTNAGPRIKLPLQATGKVKRSWFLGVRRWTSHLWSTVDRNPDLKPQPGVIYYGCMGSEATMYVFPYTGMFGRALLENHWH